MLRSAALALLVPVAAFACTYCDPSNQKLLTYRQEAKASKLVVIGTLSNAKIVGDAGTTDVAIETVLKDDAVLAGRKTLTLPRWTPIDAKKPPPKLMLFVDVFGGKLDPFRGVTLRGDGLAEYLRGAMKFDDVDRTKSLLYSFQHLDSADPDVAADAFLEFAKASDAEVGAVGPRLDATKVRKLLNDPKTPADRLGLYAFLLGACGTKADSETLIKLIDQPDERHSPALAGLLGGLIEMRPEEGWKRVVRIIDDEKRPYQDKLSALGTLRFFQASASAKHREVILAGMSAVVRRGDMADMAIEDLRRWQWWDLSTVVLSRYGEKTHAAPLVRNAIVRYALTCPDVASAAFVRSVRGSDPESVRSIEESLVHERPSKPKQ